MILKNYTDQLTSMLCKSQISNIGTVKKNYFATFHSIMKYIILGKGGNSSKRKRGIFFMKEEF